MSPERWASVRAALDRAWDAASGEQTATLKRACDGDEELCAEVESLMRADERADEFLEHPPVLELGDIPDESAHAGLLPGTRIGRYVIERLIARGGMGAVYLARQDQPSRLVAIKLLRSDLTTEAGRRAFVREVEVLGRLRHQSIAQVYEGGEWHPSADAPPQAYIAMEHIADGLAITEFATGKGLTTRARVELFTTVCDALEHAHQRAIIHRDIKPSNILVSSTREGGTPKVIDFGIARMLEDDPFETKDRTEPGRIVGTVRYMSPEQIAGRTDAIDTRSDVYALGVVLYELLTGVLPHDAHDGSAFAAMKATREHDAVPLRRRSPAIPRDLEAIVLQALRRDPELRYQSVGAMAADLRRWLGGEPVEARSAGALYGFACLMRRHKAASMGVASVFAALCIGLATTTWQAVRAARSEAKAMQNLVNLRELTRSLVFELPKILEDRGATDARRVLVERGLQYQDLLIAQSDGDPGMLREAADGYRGLAYVQGNPGSRNVGDFDGAIRSTRKAIAARQAVCESAAGTFADWDALAQEHKYLFMILGDQDRFDEAIPEAETMLRIRQQLCMDHPASYAPRNEMAESLRMFAVVCQRSAVMTGAAPIVRSGADFLDSLPSIDATTEAERAARGAMCSGLAQALEIVGAPDRAQSFFETAIADQVRLAREHPDSIVAHLNAGDVFRYRGQTRASHADAVVDLQNAVACYRRAAELKPGDFPCIDILSITLDALSREQSATGQHADAIESADAAAAIVDALVSNDGTDERAQRALVLRLHTLGVVLLAGAEDQGASVEERKRMVARSQKELSRAAECARSRPAGNGYAGVSEAIDADLARCEGLARSLAAKAANVGRDK